MQEEQETPSSYAKGYKLAQNPAVYTRVKGTNIIGTNDKSLVHKDGSTDLYLGPKAPEGKKANWLATVPGKGYFAILRLYGPTEAAIEKSWKPGDIALVK